MKVIVLNLEVAEQISDILHRVESTTDFCLTELEDAMWSELTAAIQTAVDVTGATE